ncbi:MAG: TPM domain-containing protein [Terrimicrobiaceae bacterium]
MGHREFLKLLDESAIVDTIRSAERMTSGEIRIFVSRKKPPRDGVYSAALRQFRKLGMQHTAEHNGVLLYLAPRTREMAIAADEGIHAKCGAVAWRRILATLKPGLSGNDPTGAICQAVRDIAAVLAKPFPHRPGDRNELPDSLSE